MGYNLQVRDPPNVLYQNLFDYYSYLIKGEKWKVRDVFVFMHQKKSKWHPLKPVVNKIRIKSEMNVNISGIYNKKKRNDNDNNEFF